MPRRPAGPELSSIPGAYLQALGEQRDPSAAWTEVAPPIAAALPFVAGVQRAPTAAPGPAEPPPEAEHAGLLELELARLRARVRELETPRSSVGSTALSVGRAPEPPAPPVRVPGTAKGCIGCGTTFAAGQSSQLCWGCGRTLCSACYWRFGQGPGLHRCPDCVARSRSGSDGISGGRAGAEAPPIAPTGPAPPGR